MSLFPIFLKLQDRPCLVVGAGEVAAEKISSLLQAGASLTVIAPEIQSGVQALADAGKLTLRREIFQDADLEDVFMVVAATNSSEVNHAIYLAARRRGILCNSVDDPPNCDFYFSSVVQHGDLQIAISTAGESPALAQRLRREIDEQLPADTGAWLAEVGKLRREVLAAYPPSSERKAWLHQLAQRSLCESSECPSRKFFHPSNIERGVQ